MSVPVNILSSSRGRQELGKQLSRVRFSLDVERDTVERERRSYSHSIGSSVSDAPEVVNLDFGLVKTHHTYEACAAEVKPGSTLSDIVSSCPALHVEVCEQSTPHLRVRLSVNAHGALCETLSMTLHDGECKQELQVQVTAHAMELYQGTPMLRPNVICVGSHASTNHDSDLSL